MRQKAFCGVGRLPRAVPPRPFLSDEEERNEREVRQRLRALDSRLDALHRQRETLLADAQRIGGEQRALYERRQAPQETVERLYREHGDLGRKVAELRGQRDRARARVDESVIRLRELRLTFDPTERVRPENLRREIAELELRQQTRAVPIDEENALIAQLRQRVQELRTAEARAGVVAEHERQRKEAEAAVAAARAEVESFGKAMTETRVARDQRMTEIRSTLEGAGALVAEMRAKGRERADLLARVDGLEREMGELEREGRRLLAETRARREETRRTVRTYTRRRDPATDLLESAAEAQLAELMKRGKVTLGGSP